MRKLPFLKYAAVSVGLAGLDLASKNVVSKKIPLGTDVKVWDGKLHLTHLKNKGAAMGFLEEYPRLLGFLSVVSLIWTVVTFGMTFVEKGSSIASKVGASSLLGGALGNLFDRFFNRSVTDFIYFPSRSPVFNFADLFVILGTVVYCFGQVKDGFASRRKLW